VRTDQPLDDSTSRLQEGARRHPPDAVVPPPVAERTIPAALIADDQELAVSLARAAGDLLLQIRKASDLFGKELGDEGDARVHELLVTELAAQRPADSVLSEEGVDDTARLSNSRVWIVDPLDGTREYSEGREDFAVHVALWQDGELVAGAVGLPGLGTVLSTSGVDDADRQAGPLRLAVSRSRAPELVGRVAAELSAEVVPMGSAGFKVGAVVRGVVDAYVHDGGQYEWDSAAPVAVARAAGLHATRIDGSTLEYNQPDVWLPDLVVTRREVAERVMGAIQTARTTS
jgi:3'(2'), 5'-bisphosphate nucleotidase